MYLLYLYISSIPRANIKYYYYSIIIVVVCVCVCVCACVRACVQTELFRSWLSSYGVLLQRVLWLSSYGGWCCAAGAIGPASVEGAPA